MLNVRALLGAMVIISLAACGNKAKKISISKGNQGRSGQVSEWSTDKAAYDRLIGKDEKGKPTCMILPNLLLLIEGVGEGLVSIHASDLDFVETTGSEADQANEPRMESVSGDVSAQKAAYFFKGAHKEIFFEVASGKDVRDSKQVGELLAVNVQEGCAAVSFPSLGQIANRFLIANDSGAGSAARGLRLVNPNTGERRSYAMLNRGQILVSVNKLVNDVPTCGLFPKQRRIRKSYVITRASEQGRASLSANFAGFLNAAVYSLPELKAQLDKLAEKDKNKKQEKATPRSQITSDRLNVSYPTLSFLAGLIFKEQGKLATNNCRP